MVRGTTKATAKPPTINAFSSTFALMQQSLLFRRPVPAPHARHPCYNNVLRYAKYRRRPRGWWVESRRFPLRFGENLLQFQPLSHAQGRFNLILGRLPADERPEGADGSCDLHLARIVGPRESDPGKALRPIAASYLQDSVEERDLGGRNAHAAIRFGS